MDNTTEESNVYRDFTPRGIITHSPEIGEIATALCEAQRVMEPAKKDAENPFFNSRYADLASVWSVVRGPFAENGLSVVQGSAPITRDAVVSVTTRILHKSGQWIESTMSCVAKDAGPQSVGSACSYLRRYGLSSMAGVATADDDGNLSQPTGS